MRLSLALRTILSVAFLLALLFLNGVPQASGRFQEGKDKKTDPPESKPAPKADAQSARFAEKMMEAIDTIRESYVRKLTGNDLVTRAISGLYDGVGEPVPAALQGDLKKLKLPIRKKQAELLATARRELGGRKELADGRDVTLALSGLLRKLDGHSLYIDPATLRQRQEVDHLGLKLAIDPKTEQLRVITPIRGGPAYRLGVQAGDLITKITRTEDGTGKTIPSETVATKGMSLDRANALLAGRPNTSVTLEVVREGNEKPLEIELTRRPFDPEVVFGYKRNPDATWNYELDAGNKLVYFRLPTFTENSYRELEPLVRKFVDKEGIKGLVLDLRFNAGERWAAAAAIADLFVDDGTIVTIQPRPDAGKEGPLNGRAPGSQLKIPLVVLINDASAQGSEVLAAALQDHRRAWVIGERSAGNCSIIKEHAFEMSTPDGKTEIGKIRLAQALLRRPSGSNLDRSLSPKDADAWGVRPGDFGQEVKLTPEERREVLAGLERAEIVERPEKRDKGFKAAKDRQLDAALQYLRSMVKMSEK